MAKYGIHFMVGSRKMTPKQFSNSIAGAIGGFTSNLELEVNMERDKAVVRSLFQIASIVFQRIISRTPMDEEYEFINLRKMKEMMQSASGEENFDVSEIKDIHRPDESVARYDWTMMVHGETVKIFTAKEFLSKKADFGMVFNDKDDINLILNELLKSDLKPKYITNSKGQDLPDFQISFDNPNQHFRTIEFGKYKKSNTELKQGENYVHGIDENHFSYQAPKGFYSITMKEYEAFIASHEADKWRTLSQKMLRQKVEKVISDKKFDQILKNIEKQNVSSVSTPDKACKDAAEENKKKTEHERNQEFLKALKNEICVVSDEEAERWIFYDSEEYSKYYQESFGTDDFSKFKEKLSKSDKMERDEFYSILPTARTEVAKLKQKNKGGK